MNKPFELQKKYAQFLKDIGVVEKDLVWCTQRLRWIKVKED